MSGPGCPSLSRAGEGKGDGALKGPRHASHKGMTQGTNSFRSQGLGTEPGRPFFPRIPGRGAAYRPVPSTHSLPWFLEGAQGTGAHASPTALPEVLEPPGMCWPRG